METQDYYQILNVTKDADMTQIKKAYRDLAVKYHPDRNMDDPAALDTMKQINEVYAVLSDSKKRQDYDSLRNQYGSADAYTQFRHSYSDQDIFKGTDIQKVFDELAQSFGFRNKFRFMGKISMILFKLIRIWRKKVVLMRITTHGNQRSW